MARYKDDFRAKLMMKIASVMRSWSTVFYGARENSCCPVHEVVLHFKLIFGCGLQGLWYGWIL
jgi:hypothetical protein